MMGKSRSWVCCGAHWRETKRVFNASAVVKLRLDFSGFMSTGTGSSELELAEPAMG